MGYGMVAAEYEAVVLPYWVLVEARRTDEQRPVRVLPMHARHGAGRDG